MSIFKKFFSSLAEFYRQRLRHHAWIRTPKENIWAAFVFLKWNIFWPLSYPFRLFFAKTKYIKKNSSSLTIFVALSTANLIENLFFLALDYLKIIIKSIIPNSLLLSNIRNSHKLKSFFLLKGKIYSYVKVQVKKIIPRTLLLKIHQIKNRIQTARSNGSGVLFPVRKKLIPLSKAFLLPKNLIYQEIFKAGVVNCKALKIFPKNLAASIPKIASEFEFPAILIGNLSNAKINDHSNLIDINDGVVHHDLYKFSHDFTSEELHGKIRINEKNQTIKRDISNKPYKKLTNAAVFTDSCAPNYAHWLTEVLPRLFSFGISQEKDKAPVIIDSHLHPNLEESAFAVLPISTEVLRISNNSAIEVNKLLVVSAAGYIPFEPRKGSLLDRSHGIFNGYALLAMREHLAKNLPVSKKFQGKRKLLLRRSSFARALKNEFEIEEALLPLGFSAIYPEQLTFAEQFNIFSNAEVIVGATGAAMANLIFCPKETKIIICLSAHPDHSFGYWQNMAAAVGNSITYVLGPVEGPKTHGIHANFKIDINDLKEAISNS